MTSRLTLSFFIWRVFHQDKIAATQITAVFEAKHWHYTSCSSRSNVFGNSHGMQSNGLLFNVVEVSTFIHVLLLIRGEEVEPDAEVINKNVTSTRSIQSKLSCNKGTRICWFSKTKFLRKKHGMHAGLVVKVKHEI